MEDQKDKIHDLVIQKYAGIVTEERGECAPSCSDGATPLITIEGLGGGISSIVWKTTLISGRCWKVSLVFEGRTSAGYDS
ncbi:MAG: hypothetical protein JW882_07910 [Deltaproteobacteria bacterium]|nr:hypothetical protein [Deltaproteobacteria bacterium]